MTYDDVVERLAPCGLDCSRCADYEDGEIRQMSTKLLEALGNYKTLAKMKSDGNGVFEGYDQFDALLKTFSQASCSGCRGDHVICPVTTCSAKHCQIEKKVNFCFECDEYPCEKQFSGRLRDRWLSINDRMQAIGAVAYYLEQVKQPRY
jgi:hypothetical protein